MLPLVLAYEPLSSSRRAVPVHFPSLPKKKEEGEVGPSGLEAPQNETRQVHVHPRCFSEPQSSYHCGRAAATSAITLRSCFQRNEIPSWSACASHRLGLNSVSSE